MPDQHHLFATAPRGLEDMLADELRGLGRENARVVRGGVAFSGDLATAYRACLWSRIANRILLPLTEFTAGDDSELYAGVREVDWANHLGPDSTLAVTFTGVQAAINHSRFAEQRVKDAVVDQLREQTGNRPSVDTDQPDVRINVHMQADQVTVSIDLSGDSLHRRGVREAATQAPLKENVAAAMLVRAEWPGIAAAGGGFVDPMCGSGTLAIEAAWMAGDAAPGLVRTYFGFLNWRGHDDQVWKNLLDEAIERQEAGLTRLPPILASDHDPRSVALARDNIARAGLRRHIQVECRELSEARPPIDVDTGLLAANPPYGERIGEQHELVPLYLRLGDTLRRHFSGWAAIILNGAGCQIGLRPDRTWQLHNGPIICRLERFEISPESDASDRQPAPDLINRLHKNQRQLKRWLKRENISCYRIYDADIPEYALAIDVYGASDGQWLHVQEYESPASVDQGRAQARLQAALSVIPRALNVPPQNMAFKVRRRQRGREQYERFGDQSRFLTVHEGRCRLRVNLTDYLDTGLFLDHRTVRLWLGEEARNKRMLNLFCYTGAATVHAAVGGAVSTTSVDLSKTYLDWLRRNLELNGCHGPDHQIVHADCREWLDRCRDPYDLIFLDPPSFSNSKRMDGSLDIQRDHADLIRAAAGCLSPDGVLVFSTNLRRFRLDADLDDELLIENRTAWSIPKDFQRNQRIHQCWFIRQPCD